MANYHTWFSEELSLSPNEIDWWRRVVYEIETGVIDDEDSPSCDIVILVSVKDEDPHAPRVWFSSEESGRPGNVGRLVQMFFNTFPSRRGDFFKLTWAETCSAQRVGAFGGGYMLVSAKDIIIMSTHEMLKLEMESYDDHLDDIAVAKKAAKKKKAKKAKKVKRGKK